MFGSGTRIRTGDTSGMNRMLWPTELCRHLCLLNSNRILPKATEIVNYIFKICGDFFASWKVSLEKSAGICYIIQVNGGLAQLVRASASHAEGRRFESATLHHVRRSQVHFASTKTVKAPYPLPPSSFPKQISADLFWYYGVCTESAQLHQKSWMRKRSGFLLFTSSLFTKTHSGFLEVISNSE